MASDLVTGAFGFTGSRIGSLLLARGRHVRTFSRRQPPVALPTRLTDWLAANASMVGRRYSSELGRNFRIQPARSGGSAG